MPEEVRIGSHGLPAEYRTPEGTKEDLQTALGYLEALEKSNRPVVVSVLDERMKTPGFKSRLYQQIGFLRKRPARREAPTLHLFDLNWPDPEQGCGIFMVDERLFEGATLSTVDGDDYFGLSLDAGPVKVVVLDSNTNMDEATRELSERNKREYLDLPNPRQIQEQWDAELDNRYLQKLRAETAELRQDLINRGARTAKNKSDAELMAAALRVKWRLRRQQRAGADEVDLDALWVEELAKGMSAS